MAVRASASSAGRPLPPGGYLVLISVRGWVDPKAIVRLEGLGKLKNPMTSSGIKPATSWLVAYVPIKSKHFVYACYMLGGTRQRSWLRQYATRRKVAGSIPDEVIGFFNSLNPSSHIMAPGSTQPLTEMSTRNLPGGKGRPARGADNLTANCEPIV
jgi:hypothetical protein